MDYQLLESAPDAIVIADANGRIIYVNTHAEELFGYERAEMVGESLELLVPERYRGAHVGHRTGYFASPGRRPMGAGLELYARRKDGKEFPVEISLSPIQTPQGRLVMSAIRDITDRKHAEAERARLIEERTAHAEANRLKDEFLATLSHELRTPLNAVLGWARILRSSALDPSRRAQALETIERNARAQAQLVEDLLDVSRVITGKLHVEMAPVELTAIADAAVEIVRPAAQAKNITLSLECRPRPIWVMADGDRLQQAIWNVLSNAVKFTPDGGRVDVVVTAAASRASISVRDTGRGIEPDFLHYVFDRFRQEDSSQTRVYGGLGLGLAIVRSVVEAHGGSVRAASEGPGRGATFTIELPLGISSQVRPIAAPEGSLGLRIAGLRVLIVDDVADERDLFSTVLSEQGAVVQTAGSVAAALLRAEEFRPDVVVSDIAMPGHDGYDLLRQLRGHRDPRLASVPAIAVTAHARAEDRRRALAAGFQRYVSKPVDPDDLVAAVAAARRQ